MEIKRIERKFIPNLDSEKMGKILKIAAFIVTGIIVLIIGGVLYVSLALLDVGSAPEDYKVPVENFVEKYRKKEES